jgi:hypothetical protein
VNPEGGYDYWARSTYPIASEEKTGSVEIEQTARNDARDTPITAMTLNVEVQDLPNFPYALPTDAALLQADLRTAGWAGATVTASSATIWKITLPNVAVTTYTSAWRAYFPGYYVPDMYGELTNWRSFTPATAAYFVNGANVRTDVPKQFARPKIWAL